MFAKAANCVSAALALSLSAQRTETWRACFVPATEAEIS